MTPAQLLREFETRGRAWAVDVRMPLANGNVVEGELSQVIEMPTPFLSRNDIYVSVRSGAVTISQLFAPDQDCLEILSPYRGQGPGSVEVCPRCGDAGEWRAMAVVCRNGHGPFIGGC